MKLILRADVDALGRLGEIVSVKPGYGRNYLIPMGLAMPATEANMQVFESERQKLQALMDAAKAEAMALSEKLMAQELTMRVRVGEGDKMYGSVTAANIADEFDAVGIKVNRRKIAMGEPIRSLGYHELPVKLHPDVETIVKVLVVSHRWQEGDPIPGEEPEVEEAPEGEVLEAAGEEAAGQEAVETAEAAPEAEEAVTEAPEAAPVEAAQEDELEG
jgi:large subunit ribosomal protein L9